MVLVAEAATAFALSGLTKNALEKSVSSEMLSGFSAAQAWPRTFRLPGAAAFTAPP
jgi:hypothetical protein